METDPKLGRALLDGHQTGAERADPARLATAAKELLNLIGGPLREGYRSRWQTPGT